MKLSQCQSESIIHPLGIPGTVATARPKPFSIQKPVYMLGDDIPLASGAHLTLG